MQYAPQLAHNPTNKYAYCQVPNTQFNYSKTSLLPTQLSWQIVSCVTMNCQLSVGVCTKQEPHVQPYICRLQRAINIIQVDSRDVLPYLQLLYTTIHHICRTKAATERYSITFITADEVGSSYNQLCSRYITCITVDDVGSTYHQLLIYQLVALWTKSGIRPAKDAKQHAHVYAYACALPPQK